MLNRIVPVALASGLSLCSVMSVLGAEGYHDLYLQAKKNDSAVTRAEARLDSVKAESRIVKSNLYPRVDASVGSSYINQTNLNYNGVSSQTGSVIGYNYALTARMNALHVPTLMNLDAVDAGIRSEEAGVRIARQDLIVRFSDAYFGLLKAQQDRQIAEKELDRVKQVWEQSQAFLQKGTGDIISVYEAKARLDSVTADLNRYESNEKLAEQKLSTLTGRPVAAVSDLSPLLAVGPQPENLDRWLEIMEQQDPAIRQGIEGLDRTSKELRATKAEHLPVVQASGGYVSSKGSVFLPEVETRQWYVGLSVSIPIFSGGETTARVQRAVANESERKGSLNDLRKQRAENLKQAYYNLVYNMALIKALEQKLTSAEMQLTASKKGRSIGTRSAIDVLNAEQAYSVALKDYKNTLYDNVLKNILLKSAAGVLDDGNQMSVAASDISTPVVASQPVQVVQPPVVAANQYVASGVGVLLVAPDKTGTIEYYNHADKKLKRAETCKVMGVPIHQASKNRTAGIVPFVVLDKQDNWLNVPCSTSGDTAWVEMQKEWQYLTWKDYLKSKKVSMLPDLKRDSYNVYDAEEKQVLRVMSSKDLVEVENVVEQWLLLKTGTDQLGWLRWKDAQGVLLVSVQQ